MYTLIIYLPLISAIIGLTMGRFIGERGMGILGPSLLIISSLISFIIFKDIILDGNEVNIQGITWMDVGGIFNIEWGLKFDSLTATMLIVVLTVSTLVHIYSVEYMAGDPHKVRFISYLSLFTFFMLILVTASNYLQLFIGWEGVGLCSYLLINFWTTRILAGKAAIKAMVVNRIGDVGLVLGMFLIFFNFNTLDFSIVFSSISNDTNTNLLNWIGICFLIASAGKSAQLLLHTWLPDAMEGLLYKLVVYGPSKNFAICGNIQQKFFSPLLFIKGSEKSKEVDNPQETFIDIKIKGSSETLRKAYNEKFLNWLIGFSEGDGSFIINSNKYLEFKITQSSKDADILFYIKKNLGFGSVSKQDKISNTHHYRVRDKEGLYKIINIFNGNLQLNKRQSQFKLFLDAYNNVYGSSIELLNNRNLINLNNAWISGFTDAEGCFTVSVINRENKNPNIQVRFIISQQSENILLNNIGLLFNGRLNYLKDYDGYNMVVNLTYLNPVLVYFNNFPLKTKKRISLVRWLEIYNLVINKQHLNNTEIVEYIKKRAKLINLN